MKGNAARLIPAIQRSLREAADRVVRRRAERALRENERQFRSLIEHSSDITAVVGVGGKIHYVSPSIERILGHRAKDLIGAKIQAYVHPEDAGSVTEVVVHPPAGSIIPPTEFIPTVEETGMIVPLTRWVLQTACSQMKSWQDDGVLLHSVSVNVSARHFNDCKLPGMISEILTSTGLAGSCLNIELTESVMMTDAEATIRTLSQLKALGVKISIDDFGTGYSSLSYLKRLPIDTLKIDQSFVRDIPENSEDAAIAMLIIAMAHNLNLAVVAEGVENFEQLSFLQAKKCDAMQGFLVSEPLSVSELNAFFEKNRSGPWSK